MADQLDELDGGDDLHEATRRLLSRRGFLAAGSGAALTFLGMTVVGCSSGSNDSSAGGTGTTRGPAGSAVAPTTAARASAGTASGPSLYQRLGGSAAITAVVGQFLTNVGNDQRINHFFANTNLDRLKKLLIEQIGQATGGPETYTGQSMKEAHASLKITVADFNALVGDLSAALDQYKVPSAEQQELLGALAGMKSDIVTA